MKFVKKNKGIVPGRESGHKGETVATYTCPNYPSKCGNGESYSDPRKCPNCGATTTLNKLKSIDDNFDFSKGKDSERTRR
jgi:hypothetical protein